MSEEPLSSATPDHSDGNASPEHKRRVRYAGTHPRHFTEKYKELHPDQYSADVSKVMARGQTPAGMHRSICVDEILRILKPAPGQHGLDATFGFGGHSQKILERILPGGRLMVLDVDTIELPKSEARLRALGYGEEQLIVRRMNFAGIKKACAEFGEPFQFVLADLGVSSMQIDNPERGFSFKVDGPLDLRLNPARGKPASEFLRGQSQVKLQEMLIENADEPHANAIASAIYNAFQDSTGPGLPTTRALRNCIANALTFLPKSEQKEEIKKSCQRSFQAIRIAINEEYTALDQFLAQLPSCLAPGGRVAILTFHSGEDRRVKKSFQQYFRDGIYQGFSRDPIRPSPEEQRSNPRSSCAKLRWAMRASES